MLISFIANAQELIHSRVDRYRVEFPRMGEFNSIAQEEISKIAPYRFIQSIPKIISMPSSASRIKSILKILLPNFIGTFLMIWFDAILPPGVDIIYDPYV